LFFAPSRLREPATSLSKTSLDLYPVPEPVRPSSISLFFPPEKSSGVDSTLSLSGRSFSPTFYSSILDYRADPHFHIFPKVGTAVEPRLPFFCSPFPISKLCPPIEDVDSPPPLGPFPQKLLIENGRARPFSSLFPRLLPLSDRREWEYSSARPLFLEAFATCRDRFLRPVFFLDLCSSEREFYLAFFSTRRETPYLPPLVPSFSPFFSLCQMLLCLI